MRFARDYVYVISFHKAIDEYESPQAVIGSLRGVARFLGLPKSNVCDAFRNGVTVAYFGRWQVEKIFLDDCPL